jgi:predicted peptidase
MQKQTAARKSGLSVYERGETTLFASRSDQRFSYCMYVPKAYEEDDSAYPLVIPVHGSGRGAQSFRSKFIDFAEANQCIILAPLFPCGIIEPREMDNYKFIKFHDIRYDLVLLDMVDEIAERYRVSPDRFLIHGFSGGAQFVHRFLYLHPKRLAAASIAAPGRVTLLDETLPWWMGTRDFSREFGAQPDVDALRQVAVQMIVGAEDTETWEITMTEASPKWMPGANDSGATRIDRLMSLRDSFVRHGISVQFDLVPGVGHEGVAPALLGRVKDFLAGVIQRERKRLANRVSSA